MASFCTTFRHRFLLIILMICLIHFSRKLRPETKSPNMVCRVFAGLFACKPHPGKHLILHDIWEFLRSLRFHGGCILIISGVNFRTVWVCRFRRFQVSRFRHLAFLLCCYDCLLIPMLVFALFWDRWWPPFGLVWGSTFRAFGNQKVIKML